MASAFAATAARKEARLPAGARISGSGMSTSDLFIISLSNDMSGFDYVTFRQHNQEADENSSIFNHGSTRKPTEHIKEWILILKRTFSRQDLQDY
jgi:hypothetical protein